MTTTRRALVKRIFSEAEGPLTPEEAWQRARALMPGLGQATVYRAVKELSNSGALVRVDLPGQAGRFEPAGHDHHHFFLCLACGRLVRLHSCPGHLDHLLPSGFRLDRHELLLAGRCDRCP